jgi:hypothetical protein
METSANNPGPDSSKIGVISSVRGAAPGLKGVSGKLRLLVAEAPVGVLQVEPSGAVAIAADGSTPTAIAVDTQQTLLALLRGELNPIVAALQDRLQVDGDIALALRVFMGLQGGSPWSAATRRV